MKILVLVVTYNAEKWIDKCLMSTRLSTVPVDVLVIDNCSVDNTVNLIKSDYPEVTIVVSKHNNGFGKGNNIGLKYAFDNSYDYIYLLNQDAWLFPDTIELLIKAHKDYPEFGILSPIQLQSDCKTFDQNFAFVTCNYNSNNRILSDWYFNYREEVYEVNSVMAAHWLISFDCLRRVGGFSPSFPHYGEDDNYIDRAKSKGFKIGIVSNSQAVHDRGNRIYSKKEIVKRLYISNIIVLSSVTARRKHPFLYVFLNCIRNSFKYSTIKPMGQFITVIINYRKIMKNYKNSLEDGAFLNEENIVGEM